MTDRETASVQGEDRAIRFVNRPGGIGANRVDPVPAPSDEAVGAVARKLFETYDHGPQPGPHYADELEPFYGDAQEIIAVVEPRVRAEERAAMLRRVHAILDGLADGLPVDLEYYEGYAVALHDVRGNLAHFNPEAERA